MDTTQAPIAEELTAEFMRDMMAHPEGKKIKLCIQCGTCSASCPTSYAMDYTPRQILAALRAGMLDRVVNSNTVWMCSSCYGCTVRCPQGIKLTDVMYELRRLAIKHGLFRSGQKGPALQKAFVAEVERHGRNAEMSMMARFYMSTNPFDALRTLPMGLRMFRRGRLPLGASSIRNMEQLTAITKQAEEAE